MTLSMKLGGAWKEAQSLHVKIAGEWRDVSTLYSKKDGAWVTVYSSGALIEFNDYPFPIPVATGWKYSTDGVNWTKVETDGELNTDGGMFTGFIKANEITLSDYSNGTIVGEIGLRADGNSLSLGRNSLTSFVNGGYGYVCGGYSSSSTPYSNKVDKYDSSGNRTTGTSLSVKRYDLTSFVNSSKGYVCGGFTGISKYSSVVDVYNSSGTRTTGTPLSKEAYNLTSFVIDSNAYVCGGIGSGYYSTVDVYDQSGNKTSGINLSVARGTFTSFANNSKGYVCGGIGGGDGCDTVDIYDSSGNRTTGTSLSVKRYELTSFVNSSKGYVCGGFVGGTAFYDTVDVYDKSGNRTNGNPLSLGGFGLTAFALGSNGYVCGGQRGATISSGSPVSTVDVYDESGNRTTGNSLSVARSRTTSFVNSAKAYVCGGGISNGYSTAVDVYYDEAIPEAKLPITQGSTYTLNGEPGTATESKILEFDVPVTGTIKYKKGGLLTDVVLIEYSDYPYPIPVAAGWKYSTGGSDWNEVTVDGEINTEGETFTGMVWGNLIELNDYFTEQLTYAEYGKDTGTQLDIARYLSSSFVNGGKGYVCGGRASDYITKVDIYDKYGNKTNKSLAYDHHSGTSFVLNSKGYVCGGYASGSGTNIVEVFDESGNRTNGNFLSKGGGYLISFVNGSKGYVCGGETSSVVDIYDESGNMTTGMSLSVNRSVSMPFVLNSKGYICGGSTANHDYRDTATVDVYDISGNRTSGSELSQGRYCGTSFVNADKGYVCCGVSSLNNSEHTNHAIVDVYDVSGNRTTGTSLSEAKTSLTSFVINSKGYICGGYLGRYSASSGDDNATSVVEIYDSFGNRSIGTSLNIGRCRATSFVLDSKGYVCGGSPDVYDNSSDAYSNVDIYIDIPNTYVTKLPITEGSTYTLNGESGTADVSKVMEFDSKVTGTINYVKGTIPVN